MEYTDLNDLRNQWLSGNFSYPDDMTVSGVPYHRRHSSDQPFEEIIINAQKAFIIYQTSKSYKEQAKEAGMEQWLVLIWGADEKSHVRPFDLRPIAPHRFMGMGTNQVREDVETVGDVVILKIALPSGAAGIKGKVDTGAEISSLHADKIQIMDGTAKFINRDLSDNVITVPMVEKQAVKSADGGVEYRPVIELDVEINGKNVSKALFNLNDRSHMEYPALIGQNILEKTNFLVDPKKDDPDNPDSVGESEEWVDDDFEIDFEALNEEFKNIEPVILQEADKSETLQALYKALDESDVSFQDLVRYIRTNAREVLEDIEY